MAVLNVPPIDANPPGALARFWRAFTATMLASVVAVLCLPYDPAVPFHRLRSTDYIKAAWIYDRIVRSATPIDIALIGTSHTLNGVDSVLLEHALGAAGAAPPHVANLALPHLGDDLHDLLVRLLLAHKAPKLLVVELQQVPTRAAHPIFARLADVRDVLSEPVGNPDYLDDIAQLPHRELQYFAAGWRERAPAEVADHWNDTVRTTFREGHLGPARLTAMPAADLIPQAAHQRAMLDAKAQADPRVAWLATRYNRWYLRDLLTRARGHGVRVVFLYLPVFATTSPPAGAAWLAPFGTLLTPPQQLLTDPTLWNDTEHLNYTGAKALTRWLAGMLRQAPPP